MAFGVLFMDTIAVSLGRAIVGDVDNECIGVIRGNSMVGLGI